jgi:prefoldin subunit 5
MSHSDQALLQQQLSDYAGLVENVLKPQLLLAEQTAQNVGKEIKDYHDLDQKLQQQNGQGMARNDIMVDLGYRTVFCNATITNRKTLFVNVGMGFHVELTTTEAQDFCQKRIQYLQRTRLIPQQDKISEIQEHIGSATSLLMQLQQEISNGGYNTIGGNVHGLGQ